MYKVDYGYRPLLREIYVLSAITTPGGGGVAEVPNGLFVHECGPAQTCAACSRGYCGRAGEGGRQRKQAESAAKQNVCCINRPEA